MGKTIVPVKSRGYTVMTGTVKHTPSSSSTIGTITFPRKVVAVFYTTYTGTNTGVGNSFYIRQNATFFNSFKNVFNDTSLTLNPQAYRNTNNTDYYRMSLVDDYTVKLICSYSSSSTFTTNYIAILEDELSDDTRSIFLLKGTTILTDGTPTTNVSGAIQTVKTNKYKIKSNALINISNATYIKLTN